MDVRDDHNLNR